MERDARWENIQASIGTPELTLEENVEGLNPEDWVEIRFALFYDEVPYFVWQRLLKEDLVDLVLTTDEIYKWILDEMVDIMDEYLDGTRR